MRRVGEGVTGGGMRTKKCVRKVAAFYNYCTFLGSGVNSITGSD